MINSVVATRYAEAFLQYAKETLGFQQGVEEILALRQILTDNPQLKEFLQSPDFGDKDKFQVIDHVTKDTLAKEIAHFLKLLVAKSRADKLTDICEYIRMTYGHGDMVSAVLSSAFPLDDDLIQLLKDRLEKRIQRRINLYVTFDANLLGGFKVKIGNRVFDGSLKRQISDLRERALVGRME
jgi:F-type H+-transporting ATPase subunit delta